MSGITSTRLAFTAVSSPSPISFSRAAWLILEYARRTSIASAGDEPISIGSIIVNPQANHRRPFVYKGTVKNVWIQDGSDQFGQKTCGQVLDLEDDTGSINVWYIVKCQTRDTVVTVAEGEQIIVHTTIDAPPANVMMPKGKDLGVRAMATKLFKSGL